MPTSVNKGYELQATGTNTDMWGTVLNEDVFEIVDRNLGGIVSKTLSNVNVTLTAEESQNLILRLTGALSGAVEITTACVGMTIVENLTTNAFAVTFANGAGTPVTLPQGARTVVITDGTNGPRKATEAFPSGTPMLFFSAAAPVGWTKSATHNNKAIRLVSGTGGATGGSVDFTTAFASQTPAGTVGDTTLTINQIPLHGHPFRTSNSSSNDSDSSGGLMMSLSPTIANQAAFTGTPSNTNGEQIGGTGGGQSHTHSFTGSAINLAVSYVDAIICLKD